MSDKNIKEIDILNQTLDRTIGWIENCDNKTSIILSGIGIIIGILLSADYLSKILMIHKVMMEKSLAWIWGIGLGISLGLFLYGISNLLMVLISKTKLKGTRTESNLFFGAIAQHENLQAYEEKVTNCTQAAWQHDLLSQIYSCSLICDKKFNHYKRGLLGTVISLAVFILTLLFGLNLI